MKILYAASEALPFAASGGLADVAGSLPAALTREGAVCRVVLPLYSQISETFKNRMRYITHFNVPLSWRNQYCGLFEVEENGIRYYLLDNEYYFKRGGIYGFYDDAERFIFFSKAVLEMLTVLDYVPDIIHCNDWQTAMIPVFQRFLPRNRKIPPDKNGVYNSQYSVSGQVRHGGCHRYLRAAGLRRADDYL